MPFYQKIISYPQYNTKNAQKDAAASKVCLTFDATAPLTGVSPEHARVVGNV